MASPIAEAHIAAKHRLQQMIKAAVAAAWTGLGHYDREQLDQWLATVLPLTAAANRQAVVLTQAFIARAARATPPPVDAQQVIAGIRNGATPQEVYTRPFVTVWAALGRGTAWGDAVEAGLTRATAAAGTDVQLAFTHTLRAAGSLDGQIGGYERVPDATACDFCRAAAGLVYKTGDLMPLHTGCGCGVEPILDDGTRRPLSRSSDGGDEFAPSEFDGPDGLRIAVRDHGELGPVLTNAADHFTGPAAIADAEAHTNPTS